MLHDQTKRFKAITWMFQVEPRVPQVRWQVALLAAVSQGGTMPPWLKKQCLPGAIGLKVIILNLGVSLLQFINPIIFKYDNILFCVINYFFFVHEKEVNESKHFSFDSSGERERGARNCSSIQYQRRQRRRSFRNDGLYNSIRCFYDWICTYGVSIAVQVLHVNQFIIVINWASHKNLIRIILRPI